MKRLAPIWIGVLLVAAFVVLSGDALAERAGSEKPADFAAYLKDSKLPALYVVELGRLCLEEGDLTACQRCADLLDRAGRSDQALDLADSLRCRPADAELTAMLIRARSLVGVKHYKRALGVLDTTVAMLPPDDVLTEAVLLRARCQVELGLADEALLNLRALAAKVNSDQREDYLVCRGRAEEARGDLAKAADLYAEAWDAGQVTAAMGLVRCDLRKPDTTACLALVKELSKRALPLPYGETCDLAFRLGELEPTLWNALMKTVVADTAFCADSCPSVVWSIVKLAEAGQDVTPYCGALLSRPGAPTARASLRYARAMCLKDAGQAEDSLGGLARENVEPSLSARCVGALLGSPAERRPALWRDLGAALKGTYDVLLPDERLYLSSLLIESGAKETALADLGALREGLKPGQDDQALFEIGSLVDKAGDREKALALYDLVAGSPIQSSLSLECEKRAYLLRLPLQPEVDIAKEVEKIAKKGASDLELGDLFMEKLKDYGRAAAYYKNVLAGVPEGSSTDRVRFKLAQALALESVKTGNDAARTEALDLLVTLAGNKSIKPDEILSVTKVASDWLRLGKEQVVEIATALAQRKDLTAKLAYGTAGLLCYLFEQDDLSVYQQCTTLLGRLASEPSSSKQAPYAGLMLAKLKFKAGDYDGAREAFAVPMEKSRDQLVASLASVGTGECYLVSGGIAKGLDFLKKGQAPEACFEIGWCYDLLGQPDSSEIYYRAALGRGFSATLADRVRLRLGLELLSSRGLEPALGAVDSPLLEVRQRLATARALVEACALCDAGYDALGTDALKRIGSAPSPFACEALLRAADQVATTDPAAAYGLLESATPDPAYPLEQYSLVLARARYGCSSREPGQCTEARQQLMKRYPLDRESLTELSARRALVMLEDFPGDDAQAMADSVLASGARQALVAEVLYQRGVGLLVKADYPAAERLFRQLVEDYPSSTLYGDACFKLGSAYYMMQKYQDSAINFGLAVSSGKPSLVKDALFNYSLALEQTGDFRKAAEACQTLAWRFPYGDQFERALVRTGYCLQQAGSAAEAIPVYNGLLQYSDKSETLAETRYWIGEAFAQLGDHERAACEFLRTAYLYPKEAQWAGTAAFTAGDECEKAGLVEHAITIYKQNVRKFGKTNDWGKASDERLKELAKAKQPLPASEPAKIGPAAGPEVPKGK